MKHTLLSLLLLCSALVSIAQSGNAPANAARKPNLIIILADDLGYGDLGCFGSKAIQTPNLDRMAAQGVRANQFYSGSTVCAPSRAALMMGLHTGRGYIRGNGEFPLREQDVTLPQLLKRAGYQTGLFGKWGLGDVNTTGSPDRKGWDYFAGLLHHVEGHYQAPGIAWSSTPERPVPSRINTRFGGMGGDFYTEKALEFVRKQNDQSPFFMMLALPMPHAELYAPGPAMKRYLDTNGNSKFSPEKPFVGSHYGGQPMPKAAYAAMVSLIDDYVGQIMETLRQKGFDKNTIVMFSSDNGTHTEGGRTLADVAEMGSSGPLRGVKRDMYEGGIRVPTLFWGNGLPQGAVSNSPAAFWDIVPTMTGLLGLTDVPPTTGISIWNHLKAGTPLPERPLYWEFYEGGNFQAIRQGDWKLIRKALKDKPEVFELYNLASDVGEKTDLASQQPAVLERLKTALRQQHTRAELTAFRGYLE